MKKSREEIYKATIIERCKDFSWFDETEDDKIAYAALQKCYKDLRALQSSKRFNLGKRGNYFSYLWNLVPFAKALSEHKYNRACNELVTLTINEPILQPRIYFNLLALMDKYMEE